MRYKLMSFVVVGAPFTAVRPMLYLLCIGLYFSGSASDCNTSELRSYDLMVLYKYVYYYLGRALAPPSEIRQGSGKNERFKIRSHSQLDGKPLE